MSFFYDNDYPSSNVQEDLNEKVQKLIDQIGIPNKNIPLPRKNISVNIDNEHEINNKDVNDFINKYFQSDIELMNKIIYSPESFKLVI